MPATQLLRARALRRVGEGHDDTASSAIAMGTETYDTGSIEPSGRTSHSGSLETVSPLAGDSAIGHCAPLSYPSAAIAAGLAKLIAPSGSTTQIGCVVVSRTAARKSSTPTVKPANQVSE